MAREAIPTWCFALVVVRRGDRFLIVHETQHGQRWYLPAGRVEPGESFAAAARRETHEETGVPVRLVGVLRIEHSPEPTGARLRVVFVAEPIDDTPPKTVADAESLGAAWVTLDELARYPLRHAAVRELFEYVSGGGPVFPLDILQPEGLPYRVGA
ncbi:MAG TPA: NUDIX domain-containing protein [Gemmataceae bacterium]|nr:NUDIX domain-containing protein [Gemmataceae bacterium]